MPPVLKILPNLKVQRKWSESCSPSSCSGDQYSKVKVLATRNPRYEESLEINLMHFLSSWNQASLFSTLLLGASKVWLWGCVGGRYRWFLPPMLCLISWNIGHNHATTIISNEFHKFWCIFDLRNNISKIDPKRTLFGPEGPNPADQHTFCEILAWDFTSIIQREKSSHSNG